MEIIHDKALAVTVRKDVFSWRLGMDLLAVVSTDGNLWIYRANGQRVWSFACKCRDEVVRLRWSPDGKLVFVASKSLGFRLYDIQVGKIVADGRKISSQLYALNSKTVDLDVQTVSWARGVCSQDGETQYGALFEASCCESLPKLPPLPNFASDHILTSKLAIDNLVQPQSTIDDFLMIGYAKGYLDLTLNGLFSVEPIKYDDSTEFLQIESSSDLSKHYIVARQQQPRGYRFGAIPVDMAFLKEEKAYLFKVISSCSKILLLLLYLQEIGSNIDHDCKAFLEFNARLIGLLDEDGVEQTASHHATSELYELLLTGMMSDGLKSWLENSMGEKNLRKLLKLGNNCIDQIRSKFLSLFVPAGTRLIVLLGELKSTCEWRTTCSIVGQQDTFGIELATLDKSIELMKNIMRKVYRFVVGLNNEQKLFNCFINWLETIIDDLKDEDKNIDQDQPYFSITEISEYITKRLNTFEVFGFIKGDTVHDLNPNLKSLNAQCSLIFNGVRRCFSQKIKFEPIVTFGPLISSDNVAKQNIQAKLHPNNRDLTLLTHDDRHLVVYTVACLETSAITERKVPDIFPGFLIKQATFFNEDLVLLAVENTTTKDRVKFMIVILNLENDSQDVYYFNFEDKSHLPNHIFLNIVPEQITLQDQSNRKLLSILSADLHRYVIISIK